MKLSLKEIRGLCTESSFERGLDYFKEDRVKDIEQYKNKVTVYVSGTSNYKVSIHLGKKDVDAHCTCPYDWGGYCKHIVATLIKLSKNHGRIKKAKKKNEQKIDSILDKITPEELKSFLETEFEKDPTLRTHFAIHFSGKNTKPKKVKDYKQEIEVLYNQLLGSHGFIEYGLEVDFSSVRDLTKRYMKVGNFLEAVKIYQALSEAIAENMDKVDDSDGYYGTEFDNAIAGFTDCVKKAGLKPQDKRQYIDYLFRKYVENEPDYFRENYEEALKHVCESRSDLTHWRNLVKPHLPTELPDSNGNWSEYYEAKELLMMQTHILSQLGEKEDLYDLLKKHFHRDSEFSLLYAQQLKDDGDTKQAITVAEEGIIRFQDYLTRQLREFLNELYKKHYPRKYRENMKELFLHNRGWKHYDTLKKICSRKEWKRYLKEMIQYFSNHTSYGDMVIEIHLQEGMLNKALRDVLSRNNIDTLGRYHSSLSEKYPREYFKAYKKLLIPFADKGMGRHHYQRVVQHLEKMKKIKGFKKEFNEFMETLRERYVNRPAFLDEMQGL